MTSLIAAKHAPMDIPQDRQAVKNLVAVVAKLKRSRWA